MLTMLLYKLQVVMLHLPPNWMSQGSLHVQQLDLADLRSVNAAVKQLQLEESIDMLILNAGVAAVPLSYTEDNFEMQVGTNHFGHYVLVSGLLDKLKQQVWHQQDREFYTARKQCLKLAAYCELSEHCIPASPSLSLATSLPSCTVPHLRSSHVFAGHPCAHCCCGLIGTQVWRVRH